MNAMHFFACKTQLATPKHLKCWHFPDQNKFINNKSYSLNVMIEFKLPQETCFEIIDLFNLFLFGIYNYNATY
jgi:hypothetical protein